jgi:hypothetical protein
MSGEGDIDKFEKGVWTKLERLRERDGALSMTERVMQHQLQTVWRLKKHY